MNNRKRTIIAAIFTAIVLISMGLFSFFKKSALRAQPLIEPYKEQSTNLIYNGLSCDNLSLYKENVKQPYKYPFDILFSEENSNVDLQKITSDITSEPRIKLLAYNKLAANGYKSSNKELLGVIVEIGLENGLDVLASFKNGTARYINFSEKIIIWENTTDEIVNQITKALFANGLNIVNQIEPQKDSRKRPPAKGNARISFLVSDGIYFVEGSKNTFFRDPNIKSTFDKAAELMQCLINKRSSK